MLSVETWLKPAKKIGEPIEIAVSERFLDPNTGERAKVTLVPIDSERTDHIQEACMEDVRNYRTGGTTRQLNGTRYLNALTAATIQDPPIHDKSFQEALGAKTAVEALGKLFLAGEKAMLFNEINKIYRLDPAAFEEEVAEAKNA